MTIIIDDRKSFDCYEKLSPWLVIRIGLVSVTDRSKGIRMISAFVFLSMFITEERVLAYLQEEFHGTIQYLCLVSMDHPVTAQSSMSILYIQIVLLKAINKRIPFLFPVAGMSDRRQQLCGHIPYISFSY